MKNKMKNNILILSLSLLGLMSMGNVSAQNQVQGNNANTTGGKIDLRKNNIINEGTVSVAQPQAVARFFHNGKTFEKIFYNNLIEILQVEKSKNSGVSTNVGAVSVMHARALSSIQLQQVTSMGVADVALIPLNGFETQENKNVINLFDYPYVFNDWTSIQKSFFNVSPMLGNQLIAGGAQSSPVSVLPASFRIIASVNGENPLNQDISVENAPTSLSMYTAFKNPSTVRGYNYGQTLTTPVIDMSLLDFYDQKLYQRYRYVYVTNHSMQSYALFVGNTWWASLTKEQQDIFKLVFNKVSEKTLMDTINYNNQILSALQQSKSLSFVKFDGNQMKATLGKIYSTAPKEINNILNNIKK